MDGHTALVRIFHGIGQNVYDTMVSKYKAAIKYLEEKNYTVGNKFYVVYQGEADIGKPQSGRAR